MQVDLLNRHGGKQRLFKEVQQQFCDRYPFLKIELPVTAEMTWTRGLPNEDTRQEATSLLREIGLGDQMTVAQLEKVLSDLFGTPIQVYRKSGNYWIEARMTRGWTLLQQNEQGREIQAGFQ